MAIVNQNANPLCIQGVNSGQTCQWTRKIHIDAAAIGAISLASGLGNIVKGGLGAIAAPIAGAAVGASADGFVGGAKGFGMGLLAGVGLAVAGAGTGLYQIGRGIANTPSAIQNKIDGKDWNKETREWHLYHLQDLDNHKFLLFYFQQE